MATTLKANGKGRPKLGIRKAPRWAPFSRRAGQYDAWFDRDDGRRIFDVEAACMRDLLVASPRPWVEVGVGTGRFAEALDIDEGIDPCPAVLRYAARRGIRTRRGGAEALPYASGSLGAVLLITTLCFLDNPARALAECRRVLQKDGYAIIGLVPKDSPWGKAYARKGADGHPFYSRARFYTTRAVIRLAEQAGFSLIRSTSALLDGPERGVERSERPKAGIVKGASFVGLLLGCNKAENEVK